MKKAELKLIYEVLSQLEARHFTNGKFTALLAVNTAVIQHNIRSALISKDSIPDFHKYSKAKDEVILRYCVKDNNGIPVPNGEGGYIIDDTHKTAVSYDMAAIDAKFPHVVGTLKTYMLEEQKNLDELVEIGVVKIPFNEIPFSELSVLEFKNLMPIIDFGDILGTDGFPVTEDILQLILNNS